MICEPHGRQQPCGQCTEFKLLDHGYLKAIEHWGSDQSIVEGARMSTDRGFISWEPYRRCKACDEVENSLKPGLRPCREQAKASKLSNVTVDAPFPHVWQEFPRGDMGILAYLWKHKHSTPFEMAGLTIEVQAPIFVFREWHRHRVPFGYSELSARYAPLPNLDYLPSLERCMQGGGSNKQARAHDGSVELTEDAALDWLARLEEHYARTEWLYNYGLNIGVPKELARLPVTVARYSRMRATGNLRGWLAFLALRNAPTAQYEIRVFAQVVARLLSEKFPLVMQVAGAAVAP